MGLAVGNCIGQEIMGRTDAVPSDLFASEANLSQDYLDWSVSKDTYILMYFDMDQFTFMC